MMDYMADTTAAHSPDAPTPLSLAELAYEAQRRWAPAYARAHRIKRSLSWLVATVLATYVVFYVFKADTHDALYERLMTSCVVAYLPLFLIKIADDFRLKGDSLLSAWIFAWFFLLFDGLIGIPIFNSGEYIIGALYILAALGVGGILCYGLYIPRDPSINWDAVLIEKLHFVRTARGGRSYEKIVTDYRKAEEIAASWLRRFGYRDAHMTPDRQDDGIDVESLGAIAQVKNWTTKRVGIKEVQRLAGSAKRGQACFFFAAYGYTKAAFRWAANPDHTVRLFILRPDGNIIACNYRAKRALWEAPFHLPVALRRPTSFWFVLPVSLVLFVDSIFITYVAVFMTIRNGPGWAVMFGLMAICGFGASAELAGRSVMRVINNAKSHKPLDIRKSFTREVSKQDEGLPADDFVGYIRDPISGLLNMIFDIGVQFRALGRILRARTR
jgi:hypothetical protein